jgi:hypothetical protein
MFAFEEGRVMEGGGEEEGGGEGVARTGIAVGEVDGTGAGEMRLLSIIFSPSLTFFPRAAEWHCVLRPIVRTGAVLYLTTRAICVARQGPPVASPVVKSTRASADKRKARPQISITAQCNQRSRSHLGAQGVERRDT